jgi:hypothetical protein
MAQTNTQQHHSHNSVIPEEWRKSVFSNVLDMYDMDWNGFSQRYRSMFEPCFEWLHHCSPEDVQVVLLDMRPPSSSSLPIRQLPGIDLFDQSSLLPRVDASELWYDFKPSNATTGSSSSDKDPSVGEVSATHLFFMEAYRQRTENFSSLPRYSPSKPVISTLYSSDGCPHCRQNRSQLATSNLSIHQRILRWNKENGIIAWRWYPPAISTSSTTFLTAEEEAVEMLWKAFTDAILNACYNKDVNKTKPVMWVSWNPPFEYEEVEHLRQCLENVRPLRDMLYIERGLKQSPRNPLVAINEFLQCFGSKATNFLPPA